jgi:hypothetical protein
VNPTGNCDIGKEEAMGVFVIALKRLARKCFDGEVTMAKVTYWTLALVCLLTGIVFGLLAAPATHGIIIGSNSGNVQYKNCSERKSKKQS